MSVEISTRVWKLSRRKGGEKLLLLALADMANSRGFCWPSAGTLADMTCMSERHVKRMYQKLGKEGDLFIKPRDGQSNYFIVLVGMDEEDFVAAATEHLKMSKSDAANTWRKLQIDRAKWGGKADDDDGDDNGAGGDADAGKSEKHAPNGNGAAPAPAAAQPESLNGHDDGDCDCDEDPCQNVTPKSTHDILTPPANTLEGGDKLSPCQNVTRDIAMSWGGDIAVSPDPSLTLSINTDLPKDFDSSSFWREAVEQIRGTMTRATFNDLLMYSRCEGHEGNTLKLVVVSQSAADRLNLRLRDSICRTLSLILDRPVNIHARPERLEEKRQRIEALTKRNRAAAIYARPSL